MYEPLVKIFAQKIYVSVEINMDGEIIHTLIVHNKSEFTVELICLSIKPSIPISTGNSISISESKIFKNQKLIPDQKITFKIDKKAIKDMRQKYEIFAFYKTYVYRNFSLPKIQKSNTFQYVPLKHTVPVRNVLSQTSLATDQVKLLDNIKETVENNYTIHQRTTLSPDISKAFDEEGGRGFDLPTGSLAGRFFDIYLKEISVFASIIEKAIRLNILQSDVKSIGQELGDLISGMLINHNITLKKWHNAQIHQVFGSGTSLHVKTSVEDFIKQADIETKLRCNELFSNLKIYNPKLCTDIKIPSEVPLKEHNTTLESHKFVED
ncbi:MAG: hypothetical protein ACYDBT_01340 [Desulfobulbaceae bacterium]